MPMLRSSLIVALVALLVGAASASASVTQIDTRDDANAELISSFGNPNTATYGQLIKAPDGASVLTGFTFRVIELEADVVFRAEVYAWDPVNKRATGSPLYEDFPLTTTGTELQDISIETGAVQLTPGSQYVLLFTTSKDFEAGGTNTGRYRSAPATAYPDGHFVFINNGTNEKQLTETTWSEISSRDLQFEATFASAQQSLTVSKSGNGSGTVRASAGIDCGTDCSESLAFWDIVALQAVPDPGSVFLGFSGAGCSTSPCLVEMSDDLSVNAVFADVPAPQIADVTAPQTTITKRKGKKIRFMSSEPGSTFRCKLDKGKYKACTSPYKAKNLSAGRHTFRVVATDAAGNSDKTPAKLTFNYE